MQSNAYRRVRRPALLAGSAMFALFLTATAAQAQSGAATAHGSQVLASEQSLRDATLVADASGSEIRRVSANIDRGSLVVSDSKFTAAGKGNAATLELVAANGTDAYRVTALTAGPNGASADGATVIASRQSLGAALINGNIVEARMEIAAGSISASKLALADNVQDAAATGSDLVAAVSGADGGAGLSSSQTMDAASGVAARARGGFAVSTGQLANSQIDASGNLNRAVAAGNSTMANLTLEAPQLALGKGADRASVTSRDGDAIASGAAAITISQSAAGQVKAVSFENSGEPTLKTLITGSASSSSITSEANLLTAAARGNLATTRTGVAAATITSSGEPGAPPSPIATSATVQNADVLDVRAIANGDIRVTVDGRLTGSDISVSNNAMRTIATGNQSESELSLEATTVNAARGQALATTDAAGTSVADAGAVVQSVQDYGSSIVRTMHIDPKIGVKVTGAATGARLSVEANSDLVASTGNDAANLLSVDAGTLETSLALGSLQTGTGDVLATSGSPAVPGNYGIAVDGLVADSELTVRDNRSVVSAIGNLGSNSLGVTASSVRGSAGSVATSGSLDGAFGAAADIVLASNQKVGEPSSEGALIPAIQSQVHTMTGIVANYPTGSTLRVDGNVQQATAIGNTVANELAIKATDLGVADAQVGTALVSNQYGQAHVGAAALAQFLNIAQLDSTVSVSGNVHTALASINDATNTLALDATTVAGARFAEAGADRLGLPAVAGSHVLSSQQVATGSVDSSVTTMFGGRAPTGGISASYRITGNRTTGEASANRAVNTLSVDAISGTTSAGLGNTQRNAATTQVSAMGSIVPPLGSSVGRSDMRFDGNSVTALARGNAAENNLSLSIGVDLSETPVRATTDQLGAGAGGGAVLLNLQTNDAPVTASAADTSVLVPLNAANLVGSQVSVNGNIISAAAYGNAAFNSLFVPGSRAPSAALVNNQVNTGNIYAVVTGTNRGGGGASLIGSNFTMSGNQISATAVGNQVSSAITGLR